MAVDTPELGFDTIGNATLIAYDGGPVLATDPWLDGSPYFGSWTLSHEVPAEQRAAIAACEYVWISHGHPDHLSMESLAPLRHAQLLLPDHVGHRIRDALVADGYSVRVLADRTWHQLSPRVRVACVADPNQDGVLLVDLDGVLVVDANDASERGWEYWVRREVRSHRVAFLLALSGYGDADMLNYLDESGARIEPYAARKVPPGPAIQRRVDWFGARYFVPFASMHRYQRADSVWANEYTTPVSEHARGFASTRAEILPAFVRYDCLAGTATALDPPEAVLSVREPAEFGDDWAESLTADDRAAIDAYFGAITTLRDVVDRIELAVGATEHVVTTGGRTGRAVRFEVPRASLMAAVRWQVFDDLLIGNFMRTRLIGDWPTGSLNPDFTATVCKYADNGLARTPAELRAYTAAYWRRAPLDMARHELRTRSAGLVRKSARWTRARVSEGSLPHRVGRKVYERVGR
ncbi:MAG TPA: MBL fold metallo-hydrolase [Acidimicrobiia bacterium]|nr:MBL fold metallo-hydrolase [Acidimicrobiia bacterium]